ncbi:hypothetical protein [Clostridium estertheticum]|uniref:hypothetical protein n=1 Tax=Clostridium estertheticum TaxID=238834 RepID=UPI001C7CDED5|nr:hypothetical protein [Clostridium estertheticum]MBX4272032.1 hypothetical protein [Clostridium estertheticum]WLC82417.1 hypothetical protein KTC98_24130 [Clostridium estertheticum]
MEINKKVTLTDNDRKLINNLTNYKYLKLSALMHKNRISDNKDEEKLISIDNLSDSELNYILPKIDVYIAERHEFGANLGYFDETWMFDYSALQDKIKYRLGIK